MRTRPFHLLAALAAFSLVPSACNEGVAVPDPDEEQALTESEREGLAEAILSVGTDPEVPQEAAAAPSLVPVTISVPVDESFACPLGGSLGLAGDIQVVVDEETRQGSYDHVLEKTHSECRVRSRRLAKEFVLSGSPSLTATVAAQVEAGELVGLEGSEQGTVAWQIEGRSGTCDIDFSYTVTGPATGTPRYRATGSVCGYTVDVDIQPEG